MINPPAYFEPIDADWLTDVAKAILLYLREAEYNPTSAKGACLFAYVMMAKMNGQTWEQSLMEIEDVYMNLNEVALN